MDLMKANIDNLTHLWTTIGLRTNTFHSDENINYCIVDYSEWPNRIWSNNTANDLMMKKTLAILKNSTLPVKVSTWYNTISNEAELFAHYNFIKSSEQTGMSVELTSEYDADPAIELRKVSTQSEAGLWSELFQQSFGYSISQKVIVLSFADVNYFVCYCNNCPVGVCLLFHDNPQVIGIHAMGIIPEMRRRGFAEEILKRILTNSKTLGFEYAVLQASKTGKILYDKYGFTTQFKLNNYQLKK